MPTSDAHSDILILGSGAAGLYAADHAAAAGARVTIVTSGRLASGSSYWSQGGIAAVTSGGDSFKSHAADTQHAGRGDCNTDALDVLVHEGAEAVTDLINRNMPFDRDSSGELRLGLEGGHSQHRILHALGVQTGKALVEFLIEQVCARPGVTIVEDAFAYQLLTDARGNCTGSMAHRWKHGDDLTLTAGATVLATGGYSALFARSTNPHTSVGDGLALAADAGARLADMEFVQFHPTAFYSASGQSFLLSEALRGAGATLVNAHGERFLADQAGAELAPRDVVARAIFNQIGAQSTPFVGLDIRHLDQSRLRREFGFLLDQVARHGIDATREPIPVAPAAHYCIGGVATDLDGRTGVNGLYACGEVAATGVHGANRLASNSLLECLVFGKRAANHALSSGGQTTSAAREHARSMQIDNSRELTFAARRRDVTDLLMANAGLVRDADGLSYALERLDNIGLGWGTGANVEPLEYYDCRARYMIRVARGIVAAALARTRSIGVHYRRDALAETAGAVHSNNPLEFD